MKETLADIADLVGGEVVGDGSIVIVGLSGLQEACSGDLTFLADAKYIPLLQQTKASAALVSKNAEDISIPHIRIDNPSAAFSKLLNQYNPTKENFFRGIHPTAVIAENAKLGQDVSVGPYTVIEGGVVIGDRSVICGHVYISQDAKVGKDCKFSPFVSISPNTLIGNNVRLHGGVVIGADGFGYEMVDGKHEKIPQIGVVEIQDDVEIGANSTIDRARFDKTIIGQGTKIDNLVQVGHNVIMGKNCIIVAQVGISGSVVIQDNVILAGQAGVGGHVTIGEGTIAAAKTGIIKNVPKNSRLFGYPSRDHDKAMKIYASSSRLPEYIKIINDLKQRIEDLEAKNNQK